MKYIFETEYQNEAKQIINAPKMAAFIWDLVNNGWREFKETDYEYEKAWDKIRSMLKSYGIDEEELISTYV